MDNVKILAAISVLCASTLTPTFAQEEEEPESVYQFEETIITASPIIQGNMVTRHAEMTSLVSERQIDDLNAQDLPASLRRVPGVSISRYNLIGNYGGGDGGAVFVRGHGSGRPGGEISIMVDGIPRFNGFWTHPLMDLMSMDVAERIEVQKSPRPVANGNMSFSAVDVHTKRMRREGFATRINSSFGSHGTLIGRMAHGGKTEAFDYFLSGSHRESDGHRENADGETESLYGKLGFRLDEEWDLSLLVNKTRGWAHDPESIDAPSTPVTERYETDNELYIGTLTHRFALWEGSVKLYYENGYADWRQWDAGADPPEQENGISDYENYGLRLRETSTHFGGSELLFGLDYDSYGGSFVSVRPSAPGEKLDERLTNVAPYFMISQVFGQKARITPSLGVRLNWSSEFGSQVGAQAGAVLSRDQTRLHANYARAFNLPGVYTAIFYNQYWNFAYEGDEWKDLAPEWINHFEIGGSHAMNDRLSFDLTCFHDQVTDAVRIVLPPPPPPSIQNIGEYTTQGIEATVNLIPAQDLHIFAGGAFMSTTPAEVPNAPDLALSAGLGYTLFQKLRLNLDAEYVDDQYVQGTRREQSLARVDGYSLVNLRLGYLFKTGPGIGEFSLNVENALDEGYEYRPGYPMAGRMFMAGIDIRL